MTGSAVGSSRRQLAPGSGSGARGLRRTGDGTAAGSATVAGLSARRGLRSKCFA